MVSICTSVGYVQRWTVYVPSLSPFEKSFLSGATEGASHIVNWGLDLVFNFTVLASNSEEFLSSLSIVMTEALHDARIVCTGMSSDSFRVKIAGLEMKVSMHACLYKLCMGPGCFATSMTL